MLFFFNNNEISEASTVISLRSSKLLDELISKGNNNKEKQGNELAQQHNVNQMRPLA